MREPTNRKPTMPLPLLGMALGAGLWCLITLGIAFLSWVR